MEGSAISEPQSCELCQKERGPQPLGGWIYRDQYWSAAIHQGYEVPGWLILQARRHADGPAAMSDAEAGTFGHVLKRICNAVSNVSQAQRTYVVAFGENFPHWHVLILPRLGDEPSGLRGTKLLDARDSLVDTSAAVEMAVAIGEQLSRS